MLFKGEIEGKYKETQIYPMYSKHEFLIHWDGLK